MNIFFTNPNPHIAANEHCNVHQVKMILEYSQLLSTAHHELGVCRNTQAAVYAPTHKNHPSAVWVRESVDHYVWLYNCLMHLHKLYSDRTGKVHKAYGLRSMLKRIPHGLECNGFTHPPVAAPEEFKELSEDFDVPTAYQHYLCSKFKEWKSRDKPIKVEWTCRVPSWYV